LYCDDFYSKLFQSEGWDENSAHELTRYIVNKLDNNEKETLDEDINLDEIKLRNYFIITIQ
jgi:hypothetical protein